MNRSKDYDPCQDVRVPFKTISGGITAARGFRAGAISCGIKNPDVKRLDLCMVVSDTPPR